MPAGAPYGNRNAEKWKFKKSVQLFHDAIELTTKKITYHLKQGEKAIEVTGYEFDFIGEIASELGTFKEIFSHLTKRKGFEKLKRLNNQLNTAIEKNCYYNTKRGIIKEATGLVNLKSNWHWKDRHDYTTDDEQIKMPGKIIFSEDK